MPGSNEYSKAPENRIGASNSNTAPVSTIKKESTNPSKDLIAMKMKTIPGEINVTSPLSKHTLTQSKLDMDIRHHAAKTFSKPASLQSQVDMELTHVLAKMPDELKQEMVTHGTKLINKPKWSATNASIDAGATTYKVQAGNTLGQIVADYNKKNGTSLKWQDVAKWSGIADPSKMKIGHVINFADPTQAPAAETAATPVQPTPVAPQNPVVTPTDTVAVTAPRDTTKSVVADTTKVAVPGDTTKVSAVDSTALATPVDTTGVTSPVDTTKTNSPVVFYNPQKQAFDLYGLYRSRGWQPFTVKTNYQPRFNKQGGTMNRINYFQQGGAAPQQQDLQQQIIALVQAAMQGDQKATETVNKIMEAAKAGDQQAVQLAQMIQQVVEQMKGQATTAKWGAKLGYIKSLKYAKGGKACPACEKGKQIEMKACGGKKAKKAKKRYFGGLV